MSTLFYHAEVGELDEKDADEAMFMCTSAHAVELAFMMSTAESVLMQSPRLSVDVLELIGYYLDGDYSVEDVIAGLQDLTAPEIGVIDIDWDAAVS